VQGQADIGFNQQSISSRPFFNDRGVRQQLNLNDNQFNQLNRGYQDAYTRYNRELEGLNNNNNNNNLNDQQRMQRAQQLESQFNQDFNTSRDSAFTDPQMRSRFDQLNRQHQGFNAFNDPQIRQQMNITRDQQQQLRRLSSDWREQMQQFRRNSNSNLTPEQWSQLQAQYQQQLTGLLTPQQQQMWSGMVGEQYNFPMEAYIQRDTSTQAGGLNQRGAVGNAALNDDINQQRNNQRDSGVSRQGTTQDQGNPNLAPGTQGTNQNAQGTQGGTIR